MMRAKDLSLNQESADALREFADQMPKAVQAVEGAAGELQDSFKNLQEGLGEHTEQFEDLIKFLNAACTKAQEPIAELPKVLIRTADKIEAYLAHHPAIK